MNKFPLLYFIIPDKITQKNHSGVTVIRNSAAFLEITQSIRMHALRYVKTTSRFTHIAKRINTIPVTYCFDKNLP